MGWDSHSATHYTNKGRIDIVKEVSEQYNWEAEKANFKVLKACAVGCQVYLAVEKIMKETNEKSVFGVVVLTSTKMNDDHFNFSEKSIDETMGPNYYKCPKSILKLLTPTDSEWANNWRTKCWNNANKKSLSRYPLGTKLKTEYKGEPIELVKSKPNVNKNAIWVNWNINTRFPASYLDRVGYTIL
jgi:hypothetical protein